MIDLDAVMRTEVTEQLARASLKAEAAAQQHDAALQALAAAKAELEEARFIKDKYEKWLQRLDADVATATRVTPNG